MKFYFTRNGFFFSGRVRDLVLLLRRECVSGTVRGYIGSGLQ